MEKTLWASLSKTAPEATKTSTQQGRQQTSIDGYWMIQRATETFGPCGIGWGYEIVEERWDEGAPIPVKQEDGSILQLGGKTHTIKLKLWYTLDGKRGEVVQFGHTPAVYRSKYGASDDSEAPKKSLMDAIKKCLSMLGMSADVFRGQFDDQDYRATLEAESQIEKAENKQAEIEEKQRELADYVTKHIDLIKTATQESEVKGIVKLAVRHLTNRKAIACLSELSDRGIKAITRESEIKLQELKK